jgi:hypothetical protein
MKGILRINVQTVLFSIVVLFLLLFSMNKSIQIKGDGWEYWGMTTSISNHLTPNLTREDITERNNNVKGIVNYSIDSQLGYFIDRFGKSYSYHFWGYSALCVPIYWLLSLFGQNPLFSLILTNMLLMILALWWLTYRCKFEGKTKLWLGVCLVINPIVFYISWPHPEVFSYVFIWIGLLEFIEKRSVTASFFTAIASLQNPAIAFITLFIAIHTLYMNRNALKQLRITKSLLYVSMSASIVLIPYLWYWWHYHEFSLISKISTRQEVISAAKVFSLFFDPNFGMILYVPLILGIFLWRLIKRDRITVIYTILLLIMAVVCSAQLNWNSDMTYINRYSVWMLPLVFLGTIQYIRQLHRKKYIAWILALFLSSASLMGYYSTHLDKGSYLTFHPVAKFLLAKLPALYYSPYEVFMERALGKEIRMWEPQTFINYPSIELVSDQGLRKAFEYKNGSMSYVNGNISWGSGDVTLSNPIKAGQDIFTQDVKAAFFDWNGIETKPNSKTYARWTYKESKLLLWSVEKRANISMGIASLASARNCEIYINDQLVFHQVIPPFDSQIKFSANLKNINKIIIRDSSQKVDKQQKFAFYIFSLTVE